MTTMTITLLAVSILVVASSAAASRQKSELSTSSSGVRTLDQAVEDIEELQSELKKVKEQINSGGVTKTFLLHFCSLTTASLFPIL